MTRWSTVRLGEVLVQQADVVPVDPTAEYPMAGVYSFGRGVFFRGVQLGQETSYKEFYRLHAGDLVLSRVKGWEGAIGIVPREFDCHFVSKEFPIFVPKDHRVFLPFVNLFFQSRLGRESLARAARGIGARRERVKEKEFLAIEVPLPRAEEQEQIAVFLTVLHSWKDQIHQFREKQEGEIAAAVNSVIREVSLKTKWYRMGDVAPQVKRPVEVDPLQEYTEIGVRSFGKGTFQKGPVPGLDLGSKRVFRIQRGDVVFSNVFAWEGAIAVAGRDDDGIIGSHRFMTVVPMRDVLLPEFLCAYCLSPRGIEDIRAASPGGAGRNRTLGQKKMAAIEVPVPPMKQQEVVVRILGRREEIEQAFEQSSALYGRLWAETLERVFLNEQE